MAKLIHLHPETPIDKGHLSLYVKDRKYNRDIILNDTLELKDIIRKGVWKAESCEMGGSHLREREELEVRDRHLKAV